MPARYLFKRGSDNWDLRLHPTVRSLSRARSARPDKAAALPTDTRLTFTDTAGKIPNTRPNGSPHDLLDRCATVAGGRNAIVAAMRLWLSFLLAPMVVAFALGGACAEPDALPQCVELMRIRHVVYEHAKAVQQANEKRQEISCDAARTFVDVTATFLRAIETDGAACGARADSAEQWKLFQNKVKRYGTYVCETAGEFLNPQHRPAGDFWRREELERMLPRR